MFQSKLIRGTLFVFAVITAIQLVGCAHDKNLNRAKEEAARYWQDKAYPGKAYDVQVIESEKGDDGRYRVKGIVDGDERVGTWTPESGVFSEGFYSLSKEQTKRIAELEQEVKYWKEKFENQEKENYKLKVQMTRESQTSSQ